GFISKESHEPTPDDIKKRAELAEARRIIDKWELLEFSIVPVPANPEALAGIKELNISEATQKELGIEDDEITTYIEKEVEETVNEEVEVEVKDEPKEKPIIVVPRRVLRPHRVVRRARVVINPKDVAAVVAGKLKGKMYL
ncbi:MAG: hypothetical protein ACYS8X_15050, partial [Planctomycetota bacterium]